MKKKGKILIGCVSIFLFSLLVILGAVDLRKFIGPSKVVMEDVVKLNNEVKVTESLHNDESIVQLPTIKEAESEKPPHDLTNFSEENGKIRDMSTGPPEKFDTPLLEEKDMVKIKNASTISSVKTSEGTNKKEKESEIHESLYPYSVLLSTLRSIENVKRALIIFKKKGFSPYWVKVNLGDRGIWFRVFTGFFKNKGEAEDFLRNRQITRARIKKTKFAALIDRYLSEKEMNTERQKLLKIGYSPYAIKKTSAYYLYVGAFFTREGAEEQCVELSSAGIKCEVVER